MSALSEALERQLRKIMPLPVAPVRKGTLPKLPATLKVANETKSIRLAYQEGSSDKVYHVQVVAVGNGYEVHFQYGRRGKTLIKGTKTSGPVGRLTAERIYEDLVHEKKVKGYKEV